MVIVATRKPENQERAFGTFSLGAVLRQNDFLTK